MTCRHPPVWEQELHKERLIFFCVNDQRISVKLRSFKEGNMYKFAVIEDNESTNEMLKQYLLNIWRDCVVQQYYTTDSALTALQNFDFDLVVSDIDMGPGSDKFGGLKIAKALDAATCPLLIVSGSPQPEIYREMFRALEAWDYLQKPISEADFAQQIRRGIMFRHAQLEGAAGTAKFGADLTRDADLVIDHSSRKNTVRWKGKTVKLTLTQISLLQLLVDAYDQPVLYERMIKEILSGKNKDNLRMHMSQMRKGFEAVDPEFKRIKSITMVGYLWYA
jgi:DNA-binding response OmpR family regulator